MIEVVLAVVILVSSFLLMEGVAWLTHKYIMHGILWCWHNDHHNHQHDSFFERNDLFFLIFAIPGIVFLFIGLENHFDGYFWAGLGITLYGLAYFFVHDIFIHQRLNWLRNSNWIYFKALRRAHKVHHKHLTKRDGECFGMLFVPLKYFKEAAKTK